MHHYMVLSLYCIMGVMLTSALVLKRSALLGDFANAHTELVDGNNRQQIMKIFNLTEAQMGHIYAGINTLSKDTLPNGRAIQSANSRKDIR